VTKRLIERPAGVLVVLLGPQQREERVPAVEAARPGNGEIGEESDALGLREDRVEVLTVGVPQGERSERAELDHRRKEAPEVAVTGQITQGSVRGHCTYSR
jgi:hypothetical protein